ncbi:MAG: TIGR01440 family protein [Clostridiales bacterium]|nr:TIGR01440 family protein [Clostridiales bacterium]
MDEVAAQARAAVNELLALDREDFRPVRLLVVGCSTSEVVGGRIGRASQPELGNALAGAMLDAGRAAGVDMAFQCCEHLNRGLVVERPVAEARNLEIVSVVPHPTAGGSCASAAYRLMADPVVVESIAADAGIDIGVTLIGMHLRPVAIPVRLTAGAVGVAPVSAARTRPRLIGGPRARYALEETLR